MTDRTWRLLVGALASCAVVVTALVVHREFAPPHPRDPDRLPSHVEDWRRLASTQLRIGPSVAPVTIVEFGDFQCPFCRVFHDVFASLRQHFGDSVSLVFRQFPLPMHPQAFRAAVAAECAAEQEHFGTMYDALFEGQDSLSQRGPMQYAQIAGIPDTARFSLCLHSEAAASAVSRDRAMALELGVAGTPTLLVNGRTVRGIPSESELLKIVRKSLEGQR